jgi:hypothetical protein
MVYLLCIFSNCTTHINSLAVIFWVEVSGSEWCGEVEAEPVGVQMLCKAKEETATHEGEFPFFWRLHDHILLFDLTVFSRKDCSRNRHTWTSSCTF